MPHSVLSGGPGLHGLRILVVGINYAPEHTGIAPYTTQACDHFASRGARVTVLAGFPHYPHWRVPAEYRGHLTVHEQRGDVSVVRLRHFVPARQSALRRGLYEATFAARALTRHLPFKPDVVVAVVPSLLGAAAAALIARRHGARLVVWVQDLMGPSAAQSGISGGDRVATFAGAVEGWTLRCADQVIVLNDEFRAYAEKVGVAPHSIRVQSNWTHIPSPTRAVSETRAALGWRPGETIVLHSGNMGLKQGLENVVAAAELADERREDVRFVLMGDGSQRESLQALGAGISRLQFLPPAEEADFSDILAAADFLLLNQRSSALDMSLPSKLTSYFCAGRPVVAAVHPFGGAAAQVTASGGGIIIDPEAPDALLKAVTSLPIGSMEYRAMSKSAMTYAAGHLTAGEALEALTDVVSAGRVSH